MGYLIIQLSRLCPLNDLSRLIESLQCEQTVAEAPVGVDTIRGESDAFAICFRCLFVLPLPPVNVAKS